MLKKTKNAKWQLRLKTPHKRGQKVFEQKVLDLSGTYASTKKNGGARRWERWILELGIGFLLLLL